MNFNEWLSVDEARFRGPVGGAFGNDKKRMQQKRTPPPPQEPVATAAEPTNRMDNRFQGYDTRIQYGKSIEKQIFDSLVACGMKLRPATGRQDMYEKIDGWWNNDPIQIKYRDTGDDILFEVMKDYDQGIPGRDMVGRAKFYAVLNRAGNILVVSVDEAKRMIQQIVGEAEQDGYDERGNYSYGPVTLRIRPDPQSGQRKLMAYIRPEALKQVFQTCPAKVNF